MLNEKRYNVVLLTEQLRAAGICTAGDCSDTGLVWDDSGNRIETRPDVVAILATHNPDATIATPATIAERLEAAELMIDLLLDTQGGA